MEFTFTIIEWLLTVECMKSSPYSLNFDESTINKTSQLDINVSLVNSSSKLIEKHNFKTLAILGGTTGREIAELVLKSLEYDGIDNYIAPRNSSFA